MVKTESQATRNHSGPEVSFWEVTSEVTSHRNSGGSLAKPSNWADNNSRRYHRRALLVGPTDIPSVSYSFRLPKMNSDSRLHRANRVPVPEDQSW
jgi:hypothetical protein